MSRHHSARFKLAEKGEILMGKRFLLLLLLLERLHCVFPRKALNFFLFRFFFLNIFRCQQPLQGSSHTPHLPSRNSSKAQTAWIKCAYRSQVESIFQREELQQQPSQLQRRLSLLPLSPAQRSASRFCHRQQFPLRAPAQVPQLFMVWFTLLC